MKSTVLNLLSLLLMVSSYIVTSDGVVTTGRSPKSYKLCGSVNTNNNVIDLTEPEVPGPFHDLTRSEMKQLREFLEQQPDTRIIDSPATGLNVSTLFLADLFLPRKHDVLNFLDKGGAQPARLARVVIFRGDKSPPKVEEFVCRPLPKIEKCDFLKLKGVSSTAEFSKRPFSLIETETIQSIFGEMVDKMLSDLLQQSFHATFTGCGVNQHKVCLTFDVSPFESVLTEENDKRYIWVTAKYRVPEHRTHPTGFSMLVDVTEPDTRQWSVIKVSYAGQMYDSMSQLKMLYATGEIPKVSMKPPKKHKHFKSTARPQQRAPVQVEPDGKRYSVLNQEVRYLEWAFNFRMSALTGPVLYDVRFRGERLAYEIGLSEIAVLYSSEGSHSKLATFIGSVHNFGASSRSLVPGGDCPEFSTLVDQVVLHSNKPDPVTIRSAFCLFEVNNGHPLRRHLSYGREEGGYYGGMLDSAFTLRSAVTVLSYEYILDFIFHQNGIIETRLVNTAYDKSPDSVLLEQTTDEVYLHLAHFKVDLDIAGMNNRYKTLNVVGQTVPLAQDANIEYHQTAVQPDERLTELEAVWDFNFNKTKYLIVYNEHNTTKFGEKRGFRILMNGISKQILSQGSESSISWARHQMVVTRRDDDEISPSSIYAMFDGGNPEVNFRHFYEDDDSIVDEDLVLWLTTGQYHIPHSEDNPVTTTTGHYMTYFLLPYNYFNECPSMGSRDAMYISYIDPSDRNQGLFIERNGNSREECILPRTF